MTADDNAEPSLRPHINGQFIQGQKNEFWISASHQGKSKFQEVVCFKYKAKM